GRIGSSGPGNPCVGNSRIRLFSGVRPVRLASATNSVPLAKASPPTPPSSLSVAPGCCAVKVPWPITRRAPWPVAKSAARPTQAHSEIRAQVLNILDAGQRVFSEYSNLRDVRQAKHVSGHWAGPIVPFG